MRFCAGAWKSFYFFPFHHLPDAWCRLKRAIFIKLNFIYLSKSAWINSINGKSNTCLPFIFSFLLGHWTHSSNTKVCYNWQLSWTFPCKVTDNIKSLFVFQIFITCQGFIFYLLLLWTNDAHEFLINEFSIEKLINSLRFFFNWKLSAVHPSFPI